MIETSTPAAKPVITVRRGNGAKVHRAEVTADGRITGTYCVGATNAGGRADVRFSRVAAPVDCRSCISATAA